MSKSSFGNVTPVMTVKIKFTATLQFISIEIPDDAQISDELCTFSNIFNQRQISDELYTFSNIFNQKTNL